HPALLAALVDKEACRRSAAGVALCRSGVPAALPPVRKLLADPDREVRLLVALTLVKQHDRAAVPVLIAQMDQPLGPLPAQAEDVLFHLAGEKSPVLAGNDDVSFRKYQKDWETWWKAHGARVDLAVLDEAARALGRTVVVLLDENEVIDLDSAGKERW